MKGKRKTVPLVVTRVTIDKTVGLRVSPLLVLRLVFGVVGDHLDVVLVLCLELPKFGEFQTPVLVSCWIGYGRLSPSPVVIVTLRKDLSFGGESSQSCRRKWRRKESDIYYPKSLPQCWGILLRCQNRCNPRNRNPNFMYFL